MNKFQQTDALTDYEACRQYVAAIDDIIDLAPAMVSPPDQVDDDDDSGDGWEDSPENDPPTPPGETTSEMRASLAEAVDTLVKLRPRVEQVKHADPIRASQVAESARRLCRKLRFAVKLPHTVKLDELGADRTAIVEFLDIAQGHSASSSTAERPMRHGLKPYAKYIREHPGQSGEQIAKSMCKNFDHCRRQLAQLVAEHGFINEGDGMGYFPPEWERTM